MQTNTSFTKDIKTRNNGDWSKRDEEKRKQLQRKEERKHKRIYE